MSTTSAPIRVADCGDAALRVTSTSPDRERAWETVQALSELLENQPTATGITDTVATYDAVLVEFDPLVTSHDEMRALVLATTSELTRAALVRAARGRRVFRVPVVYGGEHGPDLERVAEQQGTTPAEVVALHTAAPLVMRCFGSPGGAPMLDGPAFRAPVPRLSSPRAHVPAGAVAVAGRQAVVSARPAPGGWCVLGRTPCILVDIGREPLSDFRPGDAFQLFAIDAAEWSAHERRLAAVAR